MNDDKRRNKNHPHRHRTGKSPAFEPAANHPEKPGLRARQTAAKILAAVVDRRTPLDGMLDLENGNPAYRQLNDADRALVRAILNTALRHLPRIEAILDTLVGTPLPEGARALHHVLTVAAAQILYLDVPDHSAVDLAVEQAQIDPRNKRFASLTNAVLRRLSREKASHLTATHAIPVIPAWFFDRLIAIYGRAQSGHADHAQEAVAAQWHVVQVQACAKLRNPLHAHEQCPAEDPGAGSQPQAQHQRVASGTQPMAATQQRTHHGCAANGRTHHGHAPDGEVVPQAQRCVEGRTATVHPRQRPGRGHGHQRSGQCQPQAAKQLQGGGTGAQRGGQEALQHEGHAHRGQPAGKRQVDRYPHRVPQRA